MISLKRKLLAIIVIFTLSFLYSYPNFYGEDPCIIINDSKTEDKKFVSYIMTIFSKNDIKFKSMDLDSKNGLIIRFPSTENQFNAYELLKLEDLFNISVNIIASKKISFLKEIGARPMKMGLDLRGGVHILVKVNIISILKNNLKLEVTDLINFLNIKNITYKKISINRFNTIIINFGKGNSINIDILNHISSKFILKKKKNKLILKFNKKKMVEIKNTVMEKTIFIFNKRINELGISDSIIRRQGNSYIVIEIAGIQDISRAKKILGKTATLKFMFVDSVRNDKSKLYMFNGLSIFVKDKVILTGDSIINASAGFEHTLNKPCINIKINSHDVKNFEIETKKNIGNLMAIVYKEVIAHYKKEDEVQERVISVATIMSTLGRDFQITGLSMQESKDLALLLRSGSLPGTVSIVEEKIIGPTLGEKNIKNGILSILFSFLGIFFFMYFKYKKLGLIANFALISNILLLIALMSIIDITLTLPGLAGVAITIGMSIDANILIFERIKEETEVNNNLDNSNMEKAFKGAFSSIIDSNLTTLIIGLVLFIFGDGPIRGFAVSLSIGIITSMYSSIILTKTLIDFLSFKNVKIL